MEDLFPLKVTLNPYQVPKKTFHEKTISECIDELSSSHIIKKSLTCNSLVKQLQEELKKYDTLIGNLEEENRELKEQNKDCTKQIDNDKRKIVQYQREINRCQQEVTQYKKITKEFHIKQT